MKLGQYPEPTIAGPWPPAERCDHARGQVFGKVVQHIRASERGSDSQHHFRNIMKSINRLLVFILSLSASIVAFAGTNTLPVGMGVVPLAAISNDRDTSVSYLNLMVNKHHTVRGIYVETKVPEAGQPKAADRVVSSSVYWLKNIESRNGVVLGQGQGVKAILLRGKINSQVGRGSLVIKYLNNGIFRSYKQCRIALHRVSPHKWGLVNAYNAEPIKRIEVKTWMLGISTLTHVCPTNHTS